MPIPEFQSAWEDLSPIQRQAAEWNESPLLVLAGPGSGKTRVLTCRIARILDSSRNLSFRILGLTFTNKAADEMRSRVATFVPGLENRLFLGTFHSFCASVLRQHGTHLHIHPNFNIYAQDADLQAILNDAVDEAESISPLVSDLDRKTLSVIQRLKADLVLPGHARTALPSRNLDESTAERMAVVYQAYEAELAKKNALDFNSLILKTWELFEKFPALAKHYRKVYEYICIDEFQDTNLAQYNLIRALTGDQHRNLFVVADDDQIIYQWNGASHKRLEQFRRDYSPGVIQLPMNYRCPPEIVDLANSLIQHNLLRSADKKPLETCRPCDGKAACLLIGPFPNKDAEANGVAQNIGRLHSMSLGSVVVLARNRKLLEGIQSALAVAGIPAVIAQRKDEFESTPIVWLHSCLRLANDRHDRNYLEAVCGTFKQLTGQEIDPEHVITSAEASHEDFFSHWIAILHKRPLGDDLQGVVQAVVDHLQKKRDFRAFISFSFEWFDRLVAGQSLSDGDRDQEVFARYDEEESVWKELTKEITDSLGWDVSLEAFIQELQLRSKEPQPAPDTVRLFTIHGAKGKEFDHVYLMGLVEDELPSFQSIRKGDRSPEMEEERRNCFVAITRTIETLTLSYAQEYRGWRKKPSRFLYEMGVLCKNEPPGLFAVELKPGKISF
ncbi:MAG: ATP-dependent helicase [Desulfomonile tiedjei]|uniref:DNA 3'-5' helicase n=1 Tax=Desulfomonile tiedjei TaxID=2358 RepID=A0A9D6Z5B1_9BACT|nr:ATP-dependent helicase [Desulfomonile tiedjei]